MYSVPNFVHCSKALAGDRYQKIPSKFLLNFNDVAR